MVQFWCSFGAVLVQFWCSFEGEVQVAPKSGASCTKTAPPNQNGTKTAPKLHQNCTMIFQKFHDFFKIFKIFFPKFQDFSKKHNILSIFCDFSEKFRPWFYIFSRFFGLVGRLSEVFFDFSQDFLQI